MKNYSHLSTLKSKLSTMPTKKKARKKMDDNLVAQKQKHEIQYVIKRAGKSAAGRKLTVNEVKEAIAQVGRSRAKLYEYIRRWGYTIRTKKHK